MSDTLVPQPDFFAKHKKNMLLIMKKAATELRDYSKDLDEYVAALLQLERTYETQLSLLNAYSESQEEQEEYRRYEKKLMDVRRMKQKAASMARYRDQIGRKQENLLQNIEDSNRILDRIVGMYYDAR